MGLKNIHDAVRPKLYSFRDDFSPEEIELVIKEMAERIKNYVYMTSEDKAKEVIDSFVEGNMNFTELDSIGIVFEMTFVFADALEILGGLRRKCIKE